MYLKTIQLNQYTTQKVKQTVNSRQSTDIVKQISIQFKSLNQKEIETKSQNRQANVQSTRLKAYEPSNLQNKEVSS